MSVYKLSFQKIEIDAINFDELRLLRSFDNFKTDVPSNTQIMKRLKRTDYAQMIRDLKDGHDVYLMN